MSEENVKITDTENKNSIEEENPFIEIYGKNNYNPLHILLGLYKGQYWRLLLSTFFFIVKHACVWFLPIATANVINIAMGADEGGLQGIIINISILIVLILLNFPANWLYTKLRSTAMRYVEAGLRGALVRKLQQLSISYHTTMQSGRLQSKIIRDVEAIETLSQQLFQNVINIFLNIVVALVVTGMRSKVVLLFFVLCGPAAACTMGLFRKKIAVSNNIFRKEMEATSANVSEMVEMIPVTRAHALEQVEIDKMEQQVNAVAAAGKKLDVIQANLGAMGWCVFQIFQVLCLGFTAWLALKGQTTVGDISLYQTFFNTLVSQITNFINLIPLMAKGLESVTSVGEVLLSNNMEDYKDKLPVPVVDGNFELKNVHFNYNGKNEVLSGIDMTIKKGETIAFVGESGAGKTTLINILIGFIKATEGQVLLDGRDINDINLRDYRHHLAVVPQTSILFSGTIRDNITYGMPNVSEEKLQQIIEAANLKSVIENLPQGLDTMVGEHGAMLSGGQRQRISIARAIIRDPNVIVLDEATSALDSISEREIQEALNNLTKGRTTFIVAHRLSTIKNADKIAVIADGKCAEFGSFQELMDKKGIFFELRRTQVE